MPLGKAIESDYLTWKSEQHILTPKYNIMRSLVTLVKHYFVTMKEDDNIFKINRQRCNGFVTCKGRSGELIYITFLQDGLSANVLYPEDIDDENVYFQWTARKMQRTHQNILKEGNGDHKF